MQNEEESQSEKPANEGAAGAGQISVLFGVGPEEGFQTEVVALSDWPSGRACRLF